MIHAFATKELEDGGIQEKIFIANVRSKNYSEVMLTSENRSCAD